MKLSLLLLPLVAAKNVFDKSKINKLEPEEKIVNLLNKRSQSVMEPQMFAPHMLSSLLSQELSISLFAGMTRDDIELTDMLKNAAPGEFYVIAPTDDAIMALSKKPWEFPLDVEDPELTSMEADERAQKNIMLFLKGHIFDCEDRFTFENDAINGIHVEKMIKGKNGVLFVINGCLNQP